MTVAGEAGEASDVGSKTEAARPKGTGFFASLQDSVRWPNFREDIRAFPSIIRSRPGAAIPFLILIAGFASGATLPPAPPSTDTTTTAYSASGSISYYVFLFGLAQPFLVYLTAGFLVPRASYILGAILGVVSVLLIQGLAVARIGVFGLQVQDTGSLLAATAFGAVMQAFYGGFFAGFFRWYTNFLRQSSAKSRVAREEREKEKRRQERTSGRRPDPKSATTRPAR